jgi:antitoxin (DNA-binding transcriptional repressor) of toxin-antitoxin stability system
MDDEPSRELAFVLHEAGRAVATAETVAARAANQRSSRPLREVAAGKSFVITHRGRSVARLVPETPPDGPRLTPEQEQALAESIAWARSLKPPAEPTGLPADWPRDRDELYGEMLRERSGGDQ